MVVYGKANPLRISFLVSCLFVDSIEPSSPCFYLVAFIICHCPKTRISPLGKIKMHHFLRNSLYIRIYIIRSVPFLNTRDSSYILNRRIVYIYIYIQYIQRSGQVKTVGLRCCRRRQFNEERAKWLAAID